MRAASIGGSSGGSGMQNRGPVGLGPCAVPSNRLVRVHALQAAWHAVCHETWTCVGMLLIPSAFEWCAHQCICTVARRSMAMCVHHRPHAGMWSL